MNDGDNTENDRRSQLGPDASPWSGVSTRKGFLKGVAVAGAGATALGTLAPAAALASGGLTYTDLSILKAAQIAEALAVTTYTNIINTAPFFKNIPDDDQGYLKAAVQEEMSHYLLEESLTKRSTPFTTFYYPPGMFTEAQTTLNILVTLEDAFIAAYLVGVRHFSNANLRVTAARIMGIESDHRTLRAWSAGDVAPAGWRSRSTQTTGIPEGAPSRSNHRTTTVTSGRCCSKKSTKRSTRYCRSRARKPPKKKGSTSRSRSSSCRSHRHCRSPLGEFHSFKG